MRIYAYCEGREWISKELDKTQEELNEAIDECSAKHIAFAFLTSDDALIRFQPKVLDNCIFELREGY